MTGNELLLALRASLDDLNEPYLWDDEELFRYLSAAQLEFCKEVGGIRDSRSTITQIPASQGDVYVAFDPRILKIKRASVVGVDRPLKIMNIEEVDHPGGSDDYGSYFSGSVFDTTEGELRALVTGAEENEIRLVRPPREDLTIALTVERAPLYRIADETGDDEVEIPEQHHLALILWAKHLAFLKEDAETFDAGQSDRFFGLFTAYGERARGALKKREHNAREVIYGGL